MVCPTLMDGQSSASTQFTPSSTQSEERWAHPQCSRPVTKQSTLWVGSELFSLVHFSRLPLLFGTVQKIGLSSQIWSCFRSVMATCPLFAPWKLLAQSQRKREAKLAASLVSPWRLVFSWDRYVRWPWHHSWIWPSDCDEINKKATWNFQVAFFL